MNDLHLSTDDRTLIQHHLEELVKRLTSILILVVILSLIWSLSIDEILKWTLQKLDPCSESCVNIFSPEEWAGTRWLASGLLGVFTSAPFIMIQAYAFASPGLLPSERRAFVAWMLSIWAISILALFYTIVDFLPMLYSFGHSFNTDTGLIGRYDAAEMLKISIAISWAIILVLAASSVVMIFGKLKLIWSGNSEWWRIRVHGMMLMLLWLIIPNGLPGLFITLTILATGMVEIAGWKYFRAPIPQGYGLRDLMNQEGKIQRILYADCSCYGSTESIDPLDGMGVMKFDSVCRNKEEQNILIDSVKRFNVDQVIFSGCKIDSFPVNFPDSLRFLGCEVRSLDLSHIGNIRTSESRVDHLLAMASIVDPWSESQAADRCIEVIQLFDVNKIYFGKSRR